MMAAVANPNHIIGVILFQSYPIYISAGGIAFDFYTDFTCVAYHWLFLCTAH